MNFYFPGSAKQPTRGIRSDTTSRAADSGSTCAQVPLSLWQHITPPGPRPAGPRPQGPCLWSPRKRAPCGRHWVMWDSCPGLCYSADHCVRFPHTHGSNKHTLIPFQSTVQSTITVSLDWNPGVAGPQSQGSQGLNASVLPDFMFGIPRIMMLESGS